MTLRRPSLNAQYTTILLCISFLLTGCTPKEEQEAAADLQVALSNLVQNRALTEQFVRDVKAADTPADPAYIQAMESYQNARETYDRFLDTVETEKELRKTRSIRGVSPLDVENASADFVADATAVLKPDVNTRHIRFQRAVIVPEHLDAQLAALPKKVRDKIIDRFDAQVRWRSWGQIDEPGRAQ